MAEYCMAEIVFIWNCGIQIQTMEVDAPASVSSWAVLGELDEMGQNGTLSGAVPVPLAASSLLVLPVSGNRHATAENGGNKRKNRKSDPVTRQ